VETQVKERLTGAVILVALIVLLVPELLTGGPGSSSRPQAEAADPAAESAMRTVHIDLVDGSVRQSQPADADLSARALHTPALDPQAGLAKAGEPAAVNAQSAATVAQPPVTAATSEVDADEAAKPVLPPPVAQPAPERVKPAAKSAAAPPVQQAKATVAPQPSPERKAAPASGSGWAVQLGSFKSRDNAQRLLKQLKGKGYSAYVLGGGGGKLYKVRIGPQPDKAAASAMATKLRAAGFAGSVVQQ
jgi:DedD protein